MRAFVLLMTSIFCANTWALSYDENMSSVCAEVVILDKIATNCRGQAEFKDSGNGKFFLKASMKAGDFEIQDAVTKKNFDKLIKKNESKEIIFHSPEFTDKEWSDKLKRNFRLIDAVLMIGEDKVKLEDSMLLKKKLAKFSSYQVEIIVPFNKAPFIKLPPELKGARSFHFTITIPDSEIKGTKF